jgi:hypothetical protein
MNSGSLSILEKGSLVRHSDGVTQDYSLVELGPEHLEKVLQVQADVVGTMDDYSLYYPSPEQIFGESLRGQGLIIGCLVEGELVAFRSIWYPRDHPENLGLDIGMRDKDQLDQVAHLERSCVLAEYRGNRLQIHMTHYALDLATRNKSFRYFFSTVAPMNYASMKDKFEASMAIVQLKKKYEGFYRYTFYQDLLNPVHAASPEPVFVNGNDIDSQVRLLDSEKGIIGCAMQKNGEIMQVGYAKANHALF